MALAEVGARARTAWDGNEFVGIGGCPTPWADLDIFGWIDRNAPLRVAIAVPGPGGLRALLLCRADREWERQRQPLEHVPGPPDQPRVRWGEVVHGRLGRAVSGRNGNSVGEHLCSDLACSFYLRGRRRPRMCVVK